jgi:hypothetical protein
MVENLQLDINHGGIIGKLGDNMYLYLVTIANGREFYILDYEDDIKRVALDVEVYCIDHFYKKYTEEERTVINVRLLATDYENPTLPIKTLIRNGAKIWNGARMV